MTWSQFRISQVVISAVGLPLAFCVMHSIDGTRPWVTEFEWGGITGVVLVRIQDAVCSILHNTR